MGCHVQLVGVCSVHVAVTSTAAPLSLLSGRPKPNLGVTRELVACERVSFLRKVLFACGKSNYVAALRFIEPDAIRAFPLL